MNLALWCYMWMCWVGLGMLRWGVRCWVGYTVRGVYSANI